MQPNLPPSVLCVALLAAGCGSPSYLLRAEDHAFALARADIPHPVVVPAVAERTGASVLVDGRRLYLPPVAGLPGAQVVRVRPKRPKGLVIAGTVMMGIGLPMLLGAIGSWARLATSCKNPESICEGGWLAEPILAGMGSVHLLIGGGMAIGGAAKWSPEVRAD